MVLIWILIKKSQAKRDKIEKKDFASNECSDGIKTFILVGFQYARVNCILFLYRLEAVMDVN